MLASQEDLVTALVNKDPTFQVSDHFTVKELVYSETAVNKGIDNYPNDINAPIPLSEIASNLLILIQDILEPIRVKLAIPFSPNSCFRCYDLNQALGSKDTSQHLLGQAADLDIPGISTVDFGYWCQKEGSLSNGFGQLILEAITPGVASSGWIHLSIKNIKYNNQVLTITNRGVTKLGYNP